MRFLLACVLMVGCMLAAMVAYAYLDEWLTLGRHFDANLGWGALATLTAIGCMDLALHCVRDNSEPRKPPGPR